MARQPRFVMPGYPQHIIQRGNNRGTTFIEIEDYHHYKGKLQQACERFRCKLHAYVLMTNHVHLLLTPLTETSISQLMQSLGRYYVQYFNSKYNRSGTLYEGRYKACLIDPDQYLFTCCQYIELNPVRAGVVAHPADYPWSSYHQNALGNDDPLISSHELYHRLGATKVTRQTAYRALFDKQIDTETLKQIRNNAHSAWALGDAQFKEEITIQMGRQAEPRPRGGDRKSKKFKQQSISLRV